MKSSLFHLALAATTFSCAAPLHQPTALAQETPAPNQSTTRRIVIMNVAPSVMAWWLDPAHQMEPISLRVSRSNSEGVLPAPSIDPGKPLGDYQLPEGVTKIVSIDPQNALLIQGTPSGIAKLQEAIAILDKPEQQVEIEAQYVYMDEADIEKFGVTNFNQPTETNPFKWGVLPDKLAASTVATDPLVVPAWQIRLREMIQKGKAKIVTAPHVNAKSNYTAALRSTTQRPMMLNSLDWPKVDEANVLALMSSSIGINARPTVNSDESIDLVMAPGLSLKMEVYRRTADGFDLSGTKKEMTIPWRQQLAGIQTLQNLKDGQTILLTGQEGAKIAPPPANFKVKRSTKLVIFLTPRLVRRLQEYKPFASPTT
jgi:type II secretory pathway component GspD/PulD (secretin)